MTDTRIVVVGFKLLMPFILKYLGGVATHYCSESDGHED